MVFAQVKELLQKIVDGLNALVPTIEQAVKGYLDLPHSQRKELADLIDEARKACEACIKALGTSWWVKWRPLFWALGGFLGLALVLGILKIFFE